MKSIKLVLSLLLSLAVSCPSYAGTRYTRTHNPYTILRIDKSATNKDIRASYRELAKTCHPDADGGSESAMADLNCAKDVLLDEDLRRQLDRELGTAWESCAGDGGTVNQRHSFDGLYEEILREAENIRPRSATELWDISIEDVLSRSSAYEEILTKLSESTFSRSDLQNFSHWIAFPRAVCNAGPFLMGANGHWFYKMFGVLLLINLFSPAEGNTPLTAVQFFTGTVLFALPLMMALSLAPGSIEGRRKFSHWSSRLFRDATPQERLKLSILLFDLLKSWTRKWYARFDDKAFGDLLATRLAQVSRTAPLLTHGWLIRYLHRRISALTYAEAVSPSAATRWQDAEFRALELHMRAHPRFWRKRVRALIGELQTVDTSLSRRLAAAAEELADSLTFDPSTPARLIHQRFNFTCERALLWWRDWR